LSWTFEAMFGSALNTPSTPAPESTQTKVRGSLDEEAVL